MTDYAFDADGKIPELWHGLSPNHGGPLTPRLIVLHYDAAWSAEAARDYLMDPTAPFTPSAHLCVGRDGAAWQIVPCSRKAWHAGRSFYQGVSGLNHHALGIEINNIGWLRPDGQGGFRDPYGRVIRVRDGVVLHPDGSAYCLADELILEAHPQAGATVLAWPPYTEPQLATVEAIVRAMIARYPTITGIIRHEDCRPDKTDTGPAFPIKRFQALLDDRLSDDFGAWFTITELHIRGGPGTRFPPLLFSPLQPLRPVKVLAEQGVWRFVDAGLPGEEKKGWVHGFYLKPV